MDLIGPIQESFLGQLWFNSKERCSRRKQGRRNLRDGVTLQFGEFKGLSAKSQDHRFREIGERKNGLVRDSETQSKKNNKWLGIRISGTTTDLMGKCPLPLQRGWLNCVKAPLCLDSYSIILSETSSSSLKRGYFQKVLTNCSSPPIRTRYEEKEG